MRVDNFKFTDEQMSKVWKRLTELSDNFIQLDLDYKKLEKRYQDLENNIKKIVLSKLSATNKIKEIGKVINETD